MLYILLAIFACSGIGLLAWGISKGLSADDRCPPVGCQGTWWRRFISHRRWKQTHLLLMDQASQLQEQLPASARSGRAGTSHFSRPVCKVLPNVRSVSRSALMVAVVASSEAANLGFVAAGVPRRVR